MGAVGGFAGSPIAQQQATVSGSALGWAFMNALNASLGTYWYFPLQLLLTKYPWCERRRFYSIRQDFPKRSTCS